MQEEKITALAAAIRGSVITPGSPEYETARRVYNGMINRYPDLTIRCTNVRDIRTTVDFARENELTVAVRGGGHNGVGLAICDHGLVIDLSLMKGVRFEPDTRTVRANPGCTQADLNHAAGGFGLAVPVGVISTTGIAGLTLGGGTGYLSWCRPRSGKRPQYNCLDKRLLVCCAPLQHGGRLRELYDG